VCPEGAIQKIPGWKYYIASEKCNGCGKCIGICPTDAIRLERPTKRVNLAADGVVLAPGFQPFDPTINRKWGQGGSPRVLTGSQMEELFAEEKYLPLEAKNLAFIQCVGSRNLTEGMRHCSRVCCAYALRMAGRLREQFPDLAIDFYHMDIQHFGKSFDQFWTQVSEKITLIAANPISVKTDTRERPVVRFESLPDLACREKAYDLVVLANGICPSPDAEALADLFGMNLDTQGFLSADGIGAAVRGVFVSGTAKRPMRIDECLEDASAVSRQVIQQLGAGIQP
jgi:heterodisulfide reductase subunit A